MMSYRGNATVGAHVISSDGEALGTVKQTAGTCFKVESQHHADYWLGIDTVTNMSGAGIRINLTQGAIDQPVFDQLPHHGCHLHN